MGLFVVGTALPHGGAAGPRVESGCLKLMAGAQALHRQKLRQVTPASFCTGPVLVGVCVDGEGNPLPDWPACLGGPLPFSALASVSLSAVTQGEEAVALSRRACLSSSHVWVTHEPVSAGGCHGLWPPSPYSEVTSPASPGFGGGGSPVPTPHCFPTSHTLLPQLPRARWGGARRAQGQGLQN